MAKKNWGPDVVSKLFCSGLDATSKKSLNWPCDVMIIMYYILEPSDPVFECLTCGIHPHLIKSDHWTWISQPNDLMISLSLSLGLNAFSMLRCPAKMSNSMRSWVDAGLKEIEGYTGWGFIQPNLRVRPSYYTDLIRRIPQNQFWSDMCSD